MAAAAAAAAAVAVLAAVEVADAGVCSAPAAAAADGWAAVGREPPSPVGCMGAGAEGAAPWTVLPALQG